MGGLITDIRGAAEYSPAEVHESARRLLEALEKDETETERAASMLESASELLAKYTHYLCWVPAAEDETVSLSATYTMSDSVRIAGAPRKRMEPVDGEPELSRWAR